MEDSKSFYYFIHLVAVLSFCGITVGDSKDNQKDSAISREIFAQSQNDILVWIRKHEDHENPQKLFDQAEKLANDQQKDKYKKYRLLLTKSEYWQKNNLSGSQELASFVTQKLVQDSAQSTETSVEYALLLAEAFKLSQRYEKAAEILEGCLQNFYPGVLKKRNIIPTDIEPPARIIMEQLGEVYLQQAEQSLDLKEKTNWYSMAAGGFIRAASGYYDKQAKQSAGIPSSLLMKITTCRDALFLLGRQLRIPSFLEKQLQTDNEGLIRQLISQHKYKPALKLIERSKSSLSMDRFKLICLMGLNQPRQTMGFSKKLAILHGEDKQLRDLILNAALRFENSSPETSSKLFYLFAKVAPKNKQAPLAMLKRADYCSRHDQLKEAADIYEKIVADYSEQKKMIGNCLLKASQCYYKSGQFTKALDCGIKASASIDDGKQKRIADFLSAQSALQMALKDKNGVKEKVAKAQIAEKIFASLVNSSKDKKELLDQIILGAELASEISGMPDKAFGYYQKYIHLPKVSSATCSTMAKRLISLGITQKSPEMIKKVVETYVAKARPDRLSIAFLGLDGILKLNDPQIALGIINKIADDKTIDTSNMMVLVDILHSPAMGSCKKQTDGVLLQLVEPRLAELSKQNSPLADKMYFVCAEAAKNLSENQKALQFLNQLLKKENAYRYLDAKFMRGDLFIAIGKYEKARNDYQEIVIISQDKTLTLKASMKLAETYSKEKNWKRTAATSLLCLPLLQEFDELSKEQKDTLQRSLELACEAYTNLGDSKQFYEIASLYLKTYPNGQQAAKYRRYLKKEKGK